MNKDDLKSELSQAVKDYYMCEEELWALNEHRPSAVEDAKELTSELLNKASNIAYWAEHLLDIKD